MLYISDVYNHYAVINQQINFSNILFYNFNKYAIIFETFCNFVCLCKLFYIITMKT